MSMVKAIQSGKEHRKMYYDTRAFDHTCRCHGSCGFCFANRMYSTKKREQKMLDRLAEMC